MFIFSRYVFASALAVLDNQSTIEQGKYEQSIRALVYYSSYSNFIITYKMYIYIYIKLIYFVEEKLIYIYMCLCVYIYTHTHTHKVSQTIRTPLLK